MSFSLANCPRKSRSSLDLKSEAKHVCSISIMLYIYYTSQIDQTPKNKLQMALLSSTNTTLYNDKNKIKNCTISPLYKQYMVFSFSSISQNNMQIV